MKKNSGSPACDSTPTIRVRSSVKSVFLIIVALLALWALDATPVALPLECYLAEGMKHALQCILCGFGMDMTLHCHIAPACSGIRIATACAIYGAVVASHWWKGALAGILIGLWLNILRILAIELGTRSSPALGDFLHACALPLVLVPALFIGRALWSVISPWVRRGLAVYGTLMLLIFLLPRPVAPPTQSTAVLFCESPSPAMPRPRVTPQGLPPPTSKLDPTLQLFLQGVNDAL